MMTQCAAYCTLRHSHNDFPLAIRDLFNNDLEGWDFDSNLSQHPKFRNYSMDHTDLPRLKRGRVGGQVSHPRHVVIIGNAVIHITGA